MVAARKSPNENEQNFKARITLTGNTSRGLEVLGFAILDVSTLSGI